MRGPRRSSGRTGGFPPPWAGRGRDRGEVRRGAARSGKNLEIQRHGGWRGSGRPPSWPPPCSNPPPPRGEEKGSSSTFSQKALLLLLLLPLLISCGGTTSEEVESTAPVPVKVQAVRQGSIHRTVTATGIVMPAPGAELAVTAPQPARIAAMPKGLGDRVRRGDLLVRFEIPSLAADAAARRSDVARAQARLTVARAELERLQGLFERGIAARREVEGARREQADAEAGLAEADSARTAAASLAGREVVRAPFAGVIAERAHNPGDLVEPSSDPILRLLDPSRLQVSAAVPVDQLGAVAAGNPAEVRGPGGDAFAASVIARPGMVDPATTTATVRLAFTRGTSLPAGSPVQVEISGEEHRGAIVAPAAAVVQEGPQSFLYTVDAQSHAHRVPVRLGITNSSEVEVLAGLAPGARVVVEGQNGLPDGAAVVPETAEQKAETTVPAPAPGGQP
jgi:RND family efflux transporter MFP subunit